MLPKWDINTTVNNYKINISKDAVLSLMANFLATQTVNSNINSNTTFKKLFDTYKKQILEFLILNGQTNIDLINEQWVKEYNKYKNEIIQHYLKVIEFEFSDNQMFKIYYIDIVNHMCFKLNLKENTKDFLIKRNELFNNDKEVMAFLNSISWNNAKKLISHSETSNKALNNVDSNKLYQKEWLFIEKSIKKTS